LALAGTAAVAAAGGMKTDPVNQNPAFNRNYTGSDYMRDNPDKFSGGLSSYTKPTTPDNPIVPTPSYGQIPISQPGVVTPGGVTRNPTGVAQPYNISGLYGIPIIYGPDGKEVERRTPVEIAPNVNEDMPVKWTGKLIPRTELLRKYGIKRTMQLRHVDGVTFDFLFAIAKELDEKDSVMLLAGGEGGKGPLVLQSNGSPYRGFLDGRVNGDSFLLLLHLSAMELKKPAAKAEKEGE
jgi:hypothetical protein